jgi:Nuclear condensing complex subunits, C-term domain
VLLEHTTRSLTADGTLAALETLILPAVRSVSSDVRELGISCLGRYALLGQSAAEHHRLLLVAAASNSAERWSVRGKALEVSLLLYKLVQTTSLCAVCMLNTPVMATCSVLVHVMRCRQGLMFALSHSKVA